MCGGVGLNGKNEHTARGASNEYILPCKREELRCGEVRGGVHHGRCLDEIRGCWLWDCGDCDCDGAKATLTATAVPGQLKYSCVGREEVEGGHVSKRKGRWKWRVWRGRQFPRIGCSARGARYGMVSIDCQVGMQ